MIMSFIDVIGLCLCLPFQFHIALFYIFSRLSGPGYISMPIGWYTHTIWRGCLCGAGMLFLAWLFHCNLDLSCLVSAPHCWGHWFLDTTQNATILSFIVWRLGALLIVSVIHMITIIMNTWDEADKVRRAPMGAILFKSAWIGTLGWQLIESTCCWWCKNTDCLPSPNLPYTHGTAVYIKRFLQVIEMSKLVASVGSKLWQSYNHSLATNPLVTKCFTSFSGFIIGDSIAQLATSPVSQFDFKRTAKFAAFGFVVHAPGCHYFYKALDLMVFPASPKRWDLLE